MKQVIEIKKLGINGEGIGYIDKKIVFVPGALPQEEVEIDIIERTRTFIKAKLVRLIKESPDRIKPKWHLDQASLECGYYHLKMKKQLMYKKEAIREALRKYTTFNLDKVKVKDVQSSFIDSGFEYVANLPIVNFKNKITFGIYQRETKFLVLMTNNFRLHPLIIKTLNQLEEILNKNNCKTYNDELRVGMRFIKIRVINQSVQIVFITGRDGLKEEVINAIKDLKQVESLYFSVNTRKYQEFTKAGYKKIFGSPRIKYNYLDSKYLVGIKEEIAKNYENDLIKGKIIKSLIDPNSTLLSINSGLAFIEISHAGKVIAIEENKEYQESNKLNSKYKENITFKYGDIDGLVASMTKNHKFDTCLIQTGRFGLSDKIKESIIKSKVKEVIYASETYSTLAKDIADLEKYYELQRVNAVDTEVYTPYLTTIVKLVRK